MKKLNIQIHISVISFFMDKALKSFYKMDLGLAFSFIRCIELSIEYYIHIVPYNATAQTVAQQKRTQIGSDDVLLWSN